MLFAACDLEFDPTTSILELDLDIMVFRYLLLYQQESRMANGTADEVLSIVLVMFK